MALKDLQQNIANQKNNTSSGNKTASNTTKKKVDPYKNSTSSYKKYSGQLTQERYNELRNKGYTKEEIENAYMKGNPQMTQELYNHLRDQGYSKKEIEKGQYDREFLIPWRTQKTAGSSFGNWGRDVDAFTSWSEKNSGDISKYDLESGTKWANQFSKNAQKARDYMIQLQQAGISPDTDEFNAYKQYYDYFSGMTRNLSQNNKSYTDYRKDFMYDAGDGNYLTYDQAKKMEQQLRGEADNLNNKPKKVINTALGGFIDPQSLDDEKTAKEKNSQADALKSWLAQQDEQKAQSAWLDRNLGRGQDSEKVYQTYSNRMAAADAKKSELESKRPDYYSYGISDELGNVYAYNDEAYNKDVDAWSKEYNDYMRNVYYPTQKQFNYAESARFMTVIKNANVDSPEVKSIIARGKRRDNPAQTITSSEEPQTFADRLGNFLDRYYPNGMGGSSVSGTGGGNQLADINKAMYGAYEGTKHADTSSWAEAQLDEQLNAYYFLRGLETQDNDEAADRLAQLTNAAIAKMGIDNEIFNPLDRWQKGLRDENDNLVKDKNGNVIDNGHPVLGGIASFAAGTVLPLTMGIPEYLTMLDMYMVTGTLDKNALSLLPTQVGQRMVGNTAKQLNDLGTIDNDVPVLGGKGAGDAYQLAISIAQSALSRKMAGFRKGMPISEADESSMSKFVLTQFFGSASSAGIMEALDRGLSPEQAIALGTLNGVNEALGETISFDKIVDIHNTAGANNLIKMFLTQGGIEGSEEAFTTVLNTLSDMMVTGDKNELETAKQSYISQGMSKEAAEKQAIKDWLNGMASDFVGGFISGGFSAGGQAIGANIGRYQGNVSYLNDLSTQTAEGSKSRQMAEDYGTREKLSAYRGNQYAEQVKQDLITQNTDTAVRAIEQRLTELGETGDVHQKAQDIANATIGALSGEEAGGWTMRPSAEISANATENMRKVIKDLQNASNEFVDYSKPDSEWTDPIMKGRFLDNRILSGNKAYNALYEAERKAENTLKEHTTQVADLKEQILDYKRELGKTSPKDTARRAELNEQIREAEKSLKSHQDAIFSDGRNTYSEEQKAPTVDIDGTEYNVSGLTMEGGQTQAQVKLTDSDGNTMLVSIDDERLPDVFRNLALKINTLGWAAEEAFKHYKTYSDIRTYVYRIQAIQTFAAEQINREAFMNNRTVKALNDPVLAEYLYSHGQEIALKNRQAKTAAKSEALNKIVQMAQEKTGDLDNVRTKGKGKVDIESGYTINGTHYEGIKGKKLSAKQNAVVRMIDYISDALNIDYVIFDGDPRAAQGVYRDGGQIAININAGLAKSTPRVLAAEALSHELTHLEGEFAPEEFEILRQAVIDVAFEGNQELFEERVHAQMRMLGPNFQGNKYDQAVKELVADSCTTMLQNSRIVTEIARQNMTLAQKMGDFIEQTINKIKQAIADAFADSDPSAYRKEVKLIEKDMDRIQKIWDDALEKAIFNYNAVQTMNAKPTEIGTYDIADFTGAKNTDGTEVFQVAAFEHDEEEYRTMLQKTGMNEVEINDLFDTIDSAMEIIKGNLEALDYAWDADIDDRGFSPVKPNSDKLYKVSQDFSTLCRKRILQGAVANQLQAALNRALTRDEGIAIRDALMAIQAEGKQIEVACALCYVESARMRSPVQIQKFLDNKEKVIKDFFAGQDRKAMKLKIDQAELNERQKIYEEMGVVRGKGADDTMYDVRDPKTAPLKKLPGKIADRIREAKKAAKATYTVTAEQQKIIDTANSMTVSDFTSPEGLENLAKKHREIFDAYTSFIRNATNSKGIENDTWWRVGDSAKISDLLIRQMNDENGLRTQSWSDFQVKHLMDYIAATIELSTRGAKQHAYTKVIDYVDLMGDTGVMINMSLIPTREYSGKLEYDNVEGFVAKEAKRLREKYHKTAGTICIGVQDDQIRQLLASDFIDYVIPYHNSGMAAHTRAAMHIPSWTNYQDFQGEKKLNGAAAEENAKRFGVKLLDQTDPMWHESPNFSDWYDLDRARQLAKNAGKTGKYGVMTGGYAAMQDAARNYMQICAERGLAPKFSYGRADFSGEENYWKLLIDRKMVDNVTGDIIEQEKIQPRFDFNTIERILNDELDRYGKVKEDQNEATRRVTEAFLSGKIKAGMSSEAIAEIMQTPVDNISITNITGDESTKLTDQYQLYVTDPVMPTDDAAWERGHSEYWFRNNGYPVREDVSEEWEAARIAKGWTEGKKDYDKKGFSGIAKREGTQIDSTVSTYVKIYDYLKKKYPNSWKNIRVLDASSGLGLGTKAGLEMGFDVTDIEPYVHPDSDYFPDYMNYSSLEDKVKSGEVKPFDFVISNAVLNVIPQDTRDNMVSWFNSVLAPGGTLYVNVLDANYTKGVTTEAQRDKNGKIRNTVLTGPGDYSNSSRIIGNEVFVGRSGSVQKGFSNNELRSYLSDALPGYNVLAPEFSAGSGATAVAIKPASSLSDQYQMPDDLNEKQQANFAFNMNQQKAGGFLKHLSGVVQRRYGGTKENNYADGVGKLVDGKIYFHKNYAADVIKDQALLDKAVNALRAYDNDFQYNCMTFNPKTGEIRFDEAPDFDTAREPIPGRQITVSPDGRITRDKVSNLIWHHKWQWVKNDYTGFDVAESWNWSKTYLSILRPVPTSEYVFSDNKGKGSQAQNGTPDAAVWNEQLEYFAKDFDAINQQDQYQASEAWDEGELYNNRALVSEETIDKWLTGGWFGSNTNENYAQAYIAYLTPSQYLRMTTIYDEGRVRRESDDRTMEWVKDVSKGQPIQLKIDAAEGKVYDHEGRHRMVVLDRNGVKHIPVLLFDMDTKYSKEPLSELKLEGQNFNGMRNYATTTVHDLVPLNRAHRAEIIEKFSKKTSFEKVSEKLDGYQTLQFQQADTEYMDAVNSGNTEEQQRLVDEAASAAGYTIRAFHGSPHTDISVFDINRAGENTGVYGDRAIWFTDSESFADSMSYQQLEGSSAFRARRGSKGKVYDTYLRINNPFDLQNMTPEMRDLLWEMNLSKLRSMGMSPENSSMGNRDYFFESIDAALEAGNDQYVKFYVDYTMLQDAGYDGIVARLYANSKNDNSVEYGVFSPEQIKSADPITYDEQGNIIPLSQRFNSDRPEIQYQNYDYSEDDTMFEAEDRQKAWNDLQAENEVLEDTVTQLRKEVAALTKKAAQLNRTDKPEVRLNDARKMARQIIKDTRPEPITTRDKTEIRELTKSLADRIKEIGDYILETGKNPNEIDYSTLRSMAQDIAQDIVNNASVEIDDGGATKDMRDQMRNALKKRPIFVPQNVRADTLDWNDFQKRYRNVFTFKDNGTDIDIIYQSLLEEIPGLLDPNINNPGDMLNELADKWDLLQPKYDNPFDSFTNEAINHYTNMILQGALDGTLRQIAPTYADRMNSRIEQIRNEGKEKVKAARAEGAAALEALRTEKNARIEEIRQQGIARKQEALAKERADKWERVEATREYYQEMAKRATIRRKNSETRTKVKKLIADLNSRLTHPTERKYVPADLVNNTIKILEMIDLDTGKESVRVQERIALLQQQYAALKSDQTFAGYAYDPIMEDAITNMARQIGNTPLRNMSSTQLDTVYNTLRMLEHTIRTAVKDNLYGEEWNFYEAAKAAVKATKDNAGTRNNALGNAADWYTTNTMRPQIVFERFGGFAKGSEWEQIYDMLDKAQRYGMDLQMKFAMPFEELLKNKKELAKLTSSKESDLLDIGLKDENGETIKVTRDFMLFVYMNLFNEDNIQHVMRGGIECPEIKEYLAGKGDRGYGKGSRRAVGISPRLSDINHAIEDSTDPNEKARLLEEKENLLKEGMEYINTLRENIEKKLTDYDKKWVQAWWQFERMSSEVLNDTSMQVYGFKKFIVEQYFPIITDRNFLNVPMDTIIKDMSLENAGFTKERIHASTPIKMMGLSDVINMQANRTAQYAAMMPAIRAFNKIYKKTMPGYSTSVRDTLNKKFGDSATKFVENLMLDLQGGRRADFTIFDRLRGRMAQATLSLNPRVALSQTASFPTAAAELGWKPVLKALARGGKNNMPISAADRELIAKWSSALWYRSKGGTVELGDVKNMQQASHKVMDKLGWAMNWIEFMDSATVGRLWYAAQYYVDDNFKALQKGSDAYYEKVAEAFNRTIENTQPNYTTLQRPELLRNPDALIRQISMFMTQRLQNQSILYGAAAKYLKYRADYQAGKNGVTQDDLREMRLKAVNAATSQVAAAASITIFKFLADMLLHRANAYRRKEDKTLDAESISLAMLNNFAESLVSNMWLGSELYSAAKSMITKETYYGMELSGVTTLTETVENIVKFGQKPSLSMAKKLGESLAQYLGIPAANAEKIGQAVWYWMQDAMNGEFMEAGVERTDAMNAKLLTEAYTSGDKQAIEKYSGTFEDDDDLLDSVRSYIKTGYVSKDKQTISKPEAIKLLVQAGMRQKDAEAKVQEWTCELVTGIPFSKIKEEYMAGNITQARVTELLQKYGGRDKETAERTARSYACEKDTGHPYTDLKEAYILGEVSKNVLEKAVKKYGGMNAEDTQKKLYYYDYLKENPTSDISENRAVAYMTKLKPAGIRAKDYEDILNKADADKNGSYSQAEVGSWLTEKGYNAKQADALWSAMGPTWKTGFDAWQVKYNADMQATGKGSKNGNVSQRELGPYLVQQINAGKITMEQAEGYWKTFFSKSTTTFKKWLKKNHYKIS